MTYYQVQCQRIETEMFVYLALNDNNFKVKSGEIEFVDTCKEKPVEEKDCESCRVAEKTPKQSVLNIIENNNSGKLSRSRSTTSTVGRKWERVDYGKHPTLSPPPGYSYAEKHKYLISYVWGAEIFSGKLRMLYRGSWILVKNLHFIANLLNFLGEMLMWVW